MPSIPDPLATLSGLTTPELRARWRRIFGTDPPQKLSRDLLMRAAAHQVQADTHGRLDPRTGRRLRSLTQAFESDRFHPSPSLLGAGTGEGEGISSRWDCVPTPPLLHLWGGRPAPTSATPPAVE